MQTFARFGACIHSFIHSKADREVGTYTVPLLHSHGNLKELVCVLYNRPQSTVAVCDASRHALPTVAVQRRLFVEVIMLI